MFVSQHVRVLLVVLADPAITIPQIARSLRCCERHVVNMLLELKAAGYLESQRVGRGNRYTVFLDRRLRNPLEAHRTVGELTAFASPGPAAGAEAQP